MCLEIPIEELLGISVRGSCEGEEQEKRQCWVTGPKSLDIRGATRIP